MPTALSEQIFGISVGVSNIQPFDILAPVTPAAHAQPFGIVIGISHSQPFGDADVALLVHDQYFGDAALPAAVLDQPLDSARIAVSALRQPFGLNNLATLSHSQLFSVMDSGVIMTLAQRFDLHDKNHATGVSSQPFGDVAEAALIQSIEWQATVGGVDVHPATVNIAGNRGQFCLDCSLILYDAVEYDICHPGADLAVSFCGEPFVFAIESRSKANDGGVVTYTITAKSPAIKLAAPMAKPMEKTYGPGLASVLAQEIAGGIVVDYDLPEQFIPMNTLYAENETPIEVIRKLASAAGGIIQSKPDGTLWLRPLSDVGLPDLDTHVPAVILSDDNDFFQTAESVEQRGGYNVITVSNQSSVESPRTWLEEEQITSQQSLVRAYQVPWSGDMELLTSATDVTMLDMGIEETVIANEQIEIIDGAGAASKPILSYDPASIEYRDEVLGAITVAEDGAITTETVGTSLLILTYTTRCHLFSVRSLRLGAAQFYIEGA